MTAPRKKLARLAISKAFETRLEFESNLQHSICIYDLAKSLGIRVIFQPQPSLEGIYQKSEPPNIVLSSLRPPGRQTFTCAHEIGHHCFGHGTKIDYIDFMEKKGSSNEDEEYLANIFAAHLLMPKTTVEYGFKSRGYEIENATELEVFEVAGWLGVGYATLIDHLFYSLKLISNNHFRVLRKLQPKAIRKTIFGNDLPYSLYCVNSAWKGRPVDLSVNDVVMLPHGTEVDAGSLQLVEESVDSHFFKALRPGITRVNNEIQNMYSFIRISRNQYSGFALFRHYEDPDHD